MFFYFVSLCAAHVNAVVRDCDLRPGMGIANCSGCTDLGLLDVANENTELLELRATLRHQRGIYIRSYIIAHSREIMKEKKKKHFYYISHWSRFIEDDQHDDD